MDRGKEKPKNDREGQRTAWWQTAERVNWIHRSEMDFYGSLYYWGESVIHLGESQEPLPWAYDVLGLPVAQYWGTSERAFRRVLLAVPGSDRVHQVGWDGSADGRLFLSADEAVWNCGLIIDDDR
ncbi:hypothetical protein VTN49DRAFT_6989 [Thermomyces lanuginosus]|uniref:uncharacterized protein n=1 Tax=Thermomyces lanuginosus TaxID=5541 RepID=UPI003743CD20